MGFGAELKGFASGFRQGVQLANQTRNSQTDEYRFGRPKEKDIVSQPGLAEGAGTISTKDPAVDPGTTSSTATVGNAGGRTIGQQAYNYYRARGLSHAAAAGWAANFMQETGNDPRVVSGHRTGDNGASKFVAQWQGQRLTNLLLYTKEVKGRAHPTLQDQFDFALEEGNPKSKYADQQWAGKAAGLTKITDPKEATAYIRQWFERPSADDLNSRLKYLSGLTDEGNYGDATFDWGTYGSGDGAGAIPEEDDGSTGGGTSTDFGEVSEEEPEGAEIGDISFDLPEVDLPEITDWTEFAKLAQVPTMFAAEGGVIPEQPEMAPRTTPDKYNPGRNYTQPFANDRPTFVPRRITNPGTAAPGTPAPPVTNEAGRTSSQAALDTARANRATEQAAAKAAAEAAAAQAAAARLARENEEKSAWQKMMDQMRRGQLYRSPWERPANGNMGGNRGGYTTSGREGAGGFGSRSSSASRSSAGGGGLYEEGGMVQSFAQGGLAVSPEYWEKAVKREKRSHSQRSAGESARDVAAKRINRQQRGITSSAMDFGEDEPPAKKLKGGEKPKQKSGGEKSPPIPTPRPEPSDVTATVPTPTADTGGAIPETVGTTPRDTGRLSDEFVPSPRESVGRTSMPVPRTGATSAGALPEPDSDPGPTFAPGIEAITKDPRFTQGPTSTPGVEAISDYYRSITPPIEYYQGKPYIRDEGGRLVPYDPEMFNVPSGAPGAPSLNPSTIIEAINEAIPAIPEGGAPGGGPGAPRITADSLRQLATEAVQEGGEAARAKLQEIWETIKDKVGGLPQGAVDAYKGAVKSNAETGLFNTLGKNDAASGASKAGAEIGALGGAIPEQPAPPRPLVARPAPAGPTAGALEEQYQTDPETGELIDMTTGLPVGEKGFGWRDFLNLFLDESYKGPDGKGILFAEGGVVPEEDEEPRFQRPASQRDPQYTTSAPGHVGPSSAGQEAPARRQRPDVKPTKKLRDDVAIGLDGGIKFLTRHFGLRQEGAVPSPEDEPRQREGMMRFVRGEGAATPDELKGIDAKIDPNNELDDGYKQMNRIAQTMQFYQSAGRKDEAEAAAASLMQFGAQRFSKLGSIAANQYDSYLRTRDQEYLQGTINALEQAYKMIPDGANVDVSINPETQELQITRIDADGNEEDIPIKANQLPGIIKTVQDTSQYWKSIYQLADPQGARDERIAKRQEARDERVAENQYIRDMAITDRQENAADRRYKEQKLRDEMLEKWKVKREEAKEARDLAEARRRYPQMNWDVVTPLLADAKKAQIALSEDPDNEELIAANNQAGSALFQAVTTGTRDPAGFMSDSGVPLATFDLIATPPGGAAAAAPAGAETPPVKYPNAKRGKDKEGNPIWVVIQDGKPYQVAE